MSDGLVQDGLVRDGEPLFDPSRFRPQFSDDHILSHLRRVLRLVDELDPPADLRVHAFGVVQAMCSSMSPAEEHGSEIVRGNGAMAPALKLRR